MESSGRIGNLIRFKLMSLFPGYVKVSGVYEPVDDSTYEVGVARFIALLSVCIILPTAALV